MSSNSNSAAVPMAAPPAGSSGGKDKSGQSKGGKRLPRKASLSSFARSLTKGPRMLGRRVKHFLKDDLHIDVHYQKAPPAAVTRELAALELLAVYHRWLRGVQALLSIVVFILSLLSFPNAELAVNLTMFIISQAAILVICKVYEVKAQCAGVTNALFESRNIFTSPFFFHMVAEIILWNIQTPFIIVFWRPFLELLNYFVFLRLYSVVLYLNNAVFAYRTFCRAISAVSEMPLSTAFLLRTSLVFNQFRVAVPVALATWFSVGVLYSKAEGAGLGDGLWFSFQTLATLGYGDYTPNTVAGRAVVFIAWLAGLLLMSYVIVVTHGVVSGSAEQAGNMRTLQECHALLHQRRDRSAWVIQAAWRLSRARRHGHPLGFDRTDSGNSNTGGGGSVINAGPKPTFKQRTHCLFLSFKLVHVIAAARRTRRSLHAALRAYKETGINALTGLSTYQYHQHVQETHRAARRLQRLKDVDRVYLALRDRSVPASSLSRKDIADILLQQEDMDGSCILPPSLSGTFNFDNMVGGGGGTGGGARGSVSGDLPHLSLNPIQCNSSEDALAAGGGASAAAAAAEWRRRVSALEDKCAQMAALLRTLLDDAAAAGSDTATDAGEDGGRERTETPPP